MTTKQYANEISWTLGTCASQTYGDFSEHIEECCLDVGLYNLKCQDSYGDGWNGGLIEIQGTQYCEDFSAGLEMYILVTIDTLCKYDFRKN